jgi:hypothetical protein
MQGQTLISKLRTVTEISRELQRFGRRWTQWASVWCALLPIAWCGGVRAAPEPVLRPAGLDACVERFNAADNELYPQAVPNAKAAEFLRENVPWFECPDPEIERTYYFRWWTYRKHLKETPDGFVITEFLPPVGWASKHNTISCAAGHHLYEGRWLRDGRMLDHYTVFWLRKSTGLHRYSHWLADAIWARYCVNANAGLPRDVLPDLVRNFRRWEQERRDPNGLFWQVDGADGMEVAIGGTGYRATINSYMFGDARAIAAIARLARQDEVARQFGDEAARIKRLVQEKLWAADAQFFKMRKRPAKPGDAEPPQAGVRELYGFTPWYFNLPDAQFSEAWRQLMDPQGFYAPFGPTTAEQRHPQFSVVYRGHECQWNGPSWPYSTAVTLVALANLLNNYQQDVVTKRDYCATLKCYTRSHALREQRLEVVGSADRKTPPRPSKPSDRVEGRPAKVPPQIPIVTPGEVPPPDAALLNSLDRQPWIDENLNPYTGDWIARSLLRERKQPPEERGKDYNHSSYCDLIITGLIGLRPRADDTVEVSPLAPEDWPYFALDRIAYHGRTLTILWDKTGQRYGRGRGLRVLADGREIAAADQLTRVQGKLP